MTTLAEMQKGIPDNVKAEHDALTKDDAFRLSSELRNEAIKMDVLGSFKHADNLNARADYFKLLAESKT